MVPVNSIKSFLPRDPLEDQKKIDGLINAVNEYLASPTEKCRSAVDLTLRHISILARDKRLTIEMMRQAVVAVKLFLTQIGPPPKKFTLQSGDHHYKVNRLLVGLQCLPLASYIFNSQEQSVVLPSYPPKAFGLFCCYLHFEEVKSSHLNDWVDLAEIAVEYDLCELISLCDHEIAVSLSGLNRDQIDEQLVTEKCLKLPLSLTHKALNGKTILADLNITLTGEVSNNETDLPEERPSFQDMVTFYLSIDDQYVEASKAVLCNASHYFRTLLQGKYIESIQKEIQLHEFTLSEFEFLMDYLLNGKIPSDLIRCDSEELVYYHDLLCLKLGVENINEHFDCYLTKKISLSEENIEKIAHLAKKYRWVHLQRYCQRYIQSQSLNLFFYETEEGVLDVSTGPLLEISPECRRACGHLVNQANQVTISDEEENAYEWISEGSLVGVEDLSEDDLISCSTYAEIFEIETFPTRLAAHLKKWICFDTADSITAWALHEMNRELITAVIEFIRQHDQRFYIQLNEKNELSVSFLPFSVAEPKLNSATKRIIEKASHLELHEQHDTFFCLSEHQISLNLRKVKLLTDQYILNLVDACPNLECLWINLSPQISKKGWEALLQLKNLKKLTISNDNCEPLDVLSQCDVQKSLSHIEELHLFLDYALFKNSEVDLQFFRHIPHTTKLFITIEWKTDMQEAFSFLPRILRVYPSLYGLEVSPEIHSDRVSFILGPDEWNALIKYAANLRILKGQFTEWDLRWVLHFSQLEELEIYSDLRTLFLDTYVHKLVNACQSLKKLTYFAGEKADWILHSATIRMNYHFNSNHLEVLATLPELEELDIRGVENTNTVVGVEALKNRNKPLESLQVACYEEELDLEKFQVDKQEIINCFQRTEAKIIAHLDPERKIREGLFSSVILIDFLYIALQLPGVLKYEGNKDRFAFFRELLYTQDGHYLLNEDGLKDWLAFLPFELNKKTILKWLEDLYTLLSDDEMRKIESIVNEYNQGTMMLLDAFVQVYEGSNIRKQINAYFKELDGREELRDKVLTKFQEKSRNHDFSNLKRVFKGIVSSLKTACEEMKNEKEYDISHWRLLIISILTMDGFTEQCRAIICSSNDHS